MRRRDFTINFTQIMQNYVGPIRRQPLGNSLTDTTLSTCARYHGGFSG
jgi:hypothetical protein